jgi:DNA primase
MKETTPEHKQEYLQAGLLKPDKFGRTNSYYTRFSGCIVFPMLDKSGNITSLYGRHIGGGHHYLEGEHKGLYPAYPKEDATRLILTESIIDAATLLQLQKASPFGGGLEGASVLALYGTNGFTAEHEQAIAGLPELKEVILFFDGDDAGAQAVNETAAKLKQINAKLQISVIDTPEGEDVNSLSISHHSDVFTHLIETRQPFEALSQPSPNGKEKETAQRKRRPRLCPSI